MSDAVVLHESFETVYLDAKHIAFHYEGENLTFTDESGVFYPRVTLRRAFPLSAGNQNILVRTPDGEMERGKEIGILPDAADLAEESRVDVFRELRQHYFVPVIQRIEKIHDEFGFLYWTVDTDRGQKEFISREDVVRSARRISDTRWLVIDINQTRYEIHDLTALDETSQNLLKRYLLL